MRLTRLSEHKIDVDAIILGKKRGNVNTLTSWVLQLTKIMRYFKISPQYPTQDLDTLKNIFLIKIGVINFISSLVLV